MGYYSRQRLENVILELANEVLISYIQNPVISNVSFTYVKLTKDRSIAYIFFDKMDRKDINLSASELNKASGVFRGYLSKKMNLRKVPKVIFCEDATIDRSIKIENILKDIKESN